ncbi:NADPH-dependent F420 reductase [Negadavirga shengliensis]|uniref:NADPH-dependent F420 reductase n=1 Tax=Negadavirga shengliensis TaxID=1389218 RepID=A0ABV9SWG0_9BACT
MKKIGIIGSGNVGQALANGFKESCYQVMVGTREASKLEGLAGVEKGSVAATIKFADLLVLCVKGSVAIEILHGHPVDGKVIIDTTNPISEQPPENGVLKFFTKDGESLIGLLQKAYPNAHFVKAFNSVGSSLMYKPDFGGIKPTMFICGNEVSAKSQVAGILEAFGWEVEDMGGTEAGACLENLCVLWCIPGFRENRWNHAFKLLKT